MSKEIRQGVGLLVVTEIPKRGKVVALQTRGLFNHEENRPQYYAGGCQVTVYGGINPNESILEALFRETKEELGAEVAKILRPQKLIKVAEFKRKNERGEIYAVKINSSFLEKIRLGPDSGGIRLVTAADLKDSQDLSKFKSGVPPKILAVFPDTLGAVKKALEL